MKDAKSLLDSLMRSVGGSSGGTAGLEDLAAKARGAWDSQSTLGKGAIGGGLLGLLLGGKGLGGKGLGKLGGTAVRVGGMALVGGLAYKAWQDWQAGKQAGATPGALPAPEGTVFLPQDAGEADELSARLLQAMVAAAKADGHVTPAERQRIGGQLATLGLGAEAEALVTRELDAPLDVGRVAALARTPEEAAEIYTASVLVVDAEAPAEKGYLALLAARLKLDPALVQHIHANAASLG